MADESLWYKDAVFYEVRVGAFYDSDGDGIGDFQGLTEKLDYLQDLGVTTLWVLPFYPSPLKDDGYDISDYTGIRPDCGTMRDFKNFLREAHRRSLQVVTELVLNHTSDQHPWFRRARRAPPGSSARRFYVWSDTSEKHPEARVLFKDFETSNWTWDATAKQYYWHRFYSHQPDLNFDHPPLQKEITRIIDFWLGLGVDGLRLDAVPYLFERDGTNGENLPETHAFLKNLRQHVDRNFKNRMLLAEANQWAEDAAAYFGQADECQMVFHFPIMPRLFMSIQMEDRFPLVDILQQTPPVAEPCQWAIFLRNHDELTLEMVTDEERDYMYRVYAEDPQAKINLGIRRRLAPLLGNDRRKIELMNGLLFSLPGTPVIYYGDEIGMGDNFFLGDRNGVRTPMQWSSDRNAGFSRANPQRLYLPVIIDPAYHYETIHVEAQWNDPHSLLWWMKRLIAQRRRHKAFGRGSIELLDPKNRKVLSFLRKYGDELILVVANLSRFSQYVELPLAPYRGMVPVELFGQNRFPPIGERSYLLTLGPTAFYWFLLQSPTAAAEKRAEYRPPLLTVSGRRGNLFTGRESRALEVHLPAYLAGRRWFGGKSRTIKSARVEESLPIEDDSVFLTLVRVEYGEGGPETYLMPLSFATGERASGVAVVREKLKGGEKEEILYDAVEDPAFSAALWEAVRKRRHWRGIHGRLIASSTPALRPFKDEGPFTPHLLNKEQSNTSIAFGDRMILKLFRRMEEGINPDLEMGLFLTEKTGFKHLPRVLGFLEYCPEDARREERTTVAMLHEFIPNEGDAWQYTLDQLDRYYERVLAGGVSDPSSPQVREFIGNYFEMAQLMGTRTAEMHAALASVPEDPAFSPEPFTTLRQRALYQSLRGLAARVFPLLRECPSETEAVQKASELEPKVAKAFQRIVGRKIEAMNIRCHGDYHLGQLLFTGKDFFIFDFEGEPDRPMGERRIRRSPLKDVAGMLRSFHYATHAARLRLEARGESRMADLPSSWSRVWQTWVGGAFLRAYFDKMALGQPSLLPQKEADLNLLLHLFLLEKAVYELGYELNTRPDWIGIPVEAIAQILQTLETIP